MKQNSEKYSMEDIMHIAQNPAGKQLLEMLRNTDPHALQSAMNAATIGNFSEAQKILESLANNEETQKLIKEIGG